MIDKDGDTINSLIYKAGKLITFAMQDCLRGLDITPDQWVTLRTLYHHDGEYNQKELSELRFKEQAAMMRMLKLLESKGYVERRQSPNDGRAQRIFITKAGRKLYEKTFSHVEKCHAAVNGLLGDKERESFIRLNKKLIAGLKSLR